MEEGNAAAAEAVEREELEIDRDIEHLDEGAEERRPAHVLEACEDLEYLGVADEYLTNCGRLPRRVRGKLR